MAIPLNNKFPSEIYGSHSGEDVSFGLPDVVL
jgi:hypothetical protein